MQKKDLKKALFFWQTTPLTAQRLLLQRIDYHSTTGQSLTTTVQRLLQYCCRVETTTVQLPHRDYVECTIVLQCRVYSSTTAQRLYNSTTAQRLYHCTTAYYSVETILQYHSIETTTVLLPRIDYYNCVETCPVTWRRTPAWRASSPIWR